MEEKNKRKFGTKGEEIAARFLEENGYKILLRNFRVGRMGEVDIIARENEYICFVEVKTRSSLNFGVPSEAVNRRKQESIIRLAQVYISQKSLEHSNIRFDVVEVLMEKDDLKINLIRNAF